MDFEEIERIKKENEKLKAIFECVDKLKQLNEDIEDYALVDYKEVDKIVCENIQLKQQLALSEKQCELMAQHIREDLKCDYDEDEIYDYFKEQAKEMLKSEN